MDEALRGSIGKTLAATLEEHGMKGGPIGPTALNR
nr:hypothetical protein [Paenibacillus larvae]